ncbi:MAG: hypothetical protein JO333_14305 [Verrucomicrobia bacterium]|nr:hypothetical protein [Verrucomicrobiota bacterium]
MRNLWIALLVMTPCLFAYGGDNNCKEVSGGIVTNFLTESGTVNGQTFVFTTLGTATGDLAGGIGVYIFSFTPTGTTAVAKVHHHWVTEAGDSIFAQDATANAYQVGPYAGIYAVGGGSYTVNIIGGTGRFNGAKGEISFIGVLDTSEPDPSRWRVVLRYQGTICFAQGNQ